MAVKVKKAAKFYWAWGVTNRKMVLVRCSNRDDAEFEKDKMKMSDAKRIGFTRRKITEAEMVEQVKAVGWEIELIRDFV